MNASVFDRFWAEVLLLARARLVVGTFSSNVGRLVQLLRTQPPATFVSLQGNFTVPEPTIDAHADSAFWRGFARAYADDERELAREWKSRLG